MSDIKCIVIEDEPLAVKVLTDYIAAVPYLLLQRTFRDAILATDFLRGNSTDLIFLDIHLPRLKGMAFLKMLTRPPAVIVTTAYHQYAVEGFNLNVTDYLLKPFEFERFLTAVTKVRTAQQLPGSSAPEQKDGIYLPVQKKKVKIFFSDIIYIESQREYIKIVTGKATHVSKLSTHEIESMLPIHLFRRVHRSFIVNVGKIDAYTADSIEMHGIFIPVGRAYRSVIDNF